jgi:hypothetical protein
MSTLTSHPTSTKSAIPSESRTFYQSGSVDNEMRFYRKTSGLRFIMCVVINTASPFIVSAHYAKEIKAKKGDRLLCRKM